MGEEHRYSANPLYRHPIYYGRDNNISMYLRTQTIESLQTVYRWTRGNCYFSSWTTVILFFQMKPKIKNRKIYLPALFVLYFGWPINLIKSMIKTELEWVRITWKVWNFSIEYNTMLTIIKLFDNSNFHGISTKEISIVLSQKGWLRNHWVVKN